MVDPDRILDQTQKRLRTTGAEGHGWKGSRMVWATGKLEIVKCVWVCIYASVVTNGSGRDEEVLELCKWLSGENQMREVALMGDMNGRVRNNEMEEVGCRWGE